MIEHLGADRRTCDRRGAKYRVVAANHEDVVEFHNRAGRGVEPVYPEHVLSGNAILLAARFDDREHLFSSFVFMHDTRTQGPDRLLAIVVYLSLPRHGIRCRATAKHTGAE